MQEGHHVIMACRNMSRCIFNITSACCVCKLDVSFKTHSPSHSVTALYGAELSILQSVQLGSLILAQRKAGRNVRVSVASVTAC